MRLLSVQLVLPMVMMAPLAVASEVKVGLYSIFKPRSVTLQGDLKLTVIAEDGRRKTIVRKSSSVRCGGKNPVALQVGSKWMGAGSIEARARAGNVQVGVPKGPVRAYQGRIEIREQDGICRIINHVPLDSYARSVACRELRGAGDEAMRAQAVLTRTFALTARDRHPGQGIDLCDLTHCQVYTGPEACSKTQLRALEAVSGLALLYRGKPAKAYYFSTCGGHTGAAGDVWGPPTARPYLRGVRDGKTPFCSRSSHMRWRFEIDRSRLCKKLAGHLKRLGKGPCQVEIKKNGRGGWVRQVEIRARGKVEMSGDNFHLLMGKIFGWSAFKSTRFTVNSSAGRIIFQGRGMGHGVGMCQYGAMGMARKGKGFQEILKHYFPGTEVGPWP